MTVYTDGGCSGNPGPGAWAFVVIDCDGIPCNNERIVFEKSGADSATTNNRMELKAVIEALTYIKEHCGKNKTTLVTDSQYAKGGVTGWMANWKNNGWKTSDKKPVKNKELWQEIDNLIKETCVKFQWVKGHAGNPYNERCDELVCKLHG